MNGAQALLGTLAAGGIELCFMNPGTTEIHLVSALDSVPALRSVSCLFEGVASGAADGYARMAGKPACTLFHLGPGLSNALANLHNACRARIPMVNLVGDHATFHRPLDPPLASDIEALARPLSAWLKSVTTAAQAGDAAAEALAQARLAPGRIATLVVPSDVAWSDGARIADVLPASAPALPESARIEETARLLRNGRKSALLLGAHTLQGGALLAAARIAHATGAMLLAPFAFARMERGAGRPAVERIAYVTTQALAQLSDLEQMVLVGAPEPVAFFGHPARPGRLLPPACTLVPLVEASDDCAGALSALAGALDCATGEFAAQPLAPQQAARGPIAPEGVAQTIAALLPEGAIVVDESITSGRGLMAATRAAPPHDWLVNPGGSIGIAVPLAVGASLGAPGRPVLCLEGDGSLMYTLQALWTAARESLPITTVVFANRSYAILEGELAAAFAHPGARARKALELEPPTIDFTGLATSLGVRARPVTTLEEFARALRAGFESREPNLIEVML